MSSCGLDKAYRYPGSCWRAARVTGDQQRPDVVTTGRHARHAPADDSALHMRPIACDTAIAALPGWDNLGG